MKEEDTALLFNLCRMAGHKNPESIAHTIQSWEQALQLVQFPLDGVIAEFGPGISPKIQLALKSTPFMGKLALVDTNQQALAVQNIVAGLSRPNFEVETFQENLFDIPFDRFDLITANHLIDDLVAVEYAHIWEIDYARVFSNPELQQEFWTRLNTDFQPGKDIMKKFAQKFENLRNGSSLIVNSYKPNFDKLHQIDARETICSEFLLVFKRFLYASGFSDIAKSDTLSHNGDWLLMKRG